MHLLCPHCYGPIDLTDLHSREVVCPACGSSFQLQPASTTDWRSSTGERKLGKFEILSDLGVGAFSTVYKARDTELDRIIALKVPRAGDLSSREDQDRFLREARSTAQLRHPNIVPLYEVGQAKGMADYRAGDFTAAIKVLTRTLSLEQENPQYSSPYLAGTAYVLLAMAHHRQGQAHQAREALDKATKLEKMPVEKSGEWENWLRFRVVYQEAEQLLKSKAESPD